MMGNRQKVAGTTGGDQEQGSEIRQPWTDSPLSNRVAIFRFLKLSVKWGGQQDDRAAVRITWESIWRRAPNTVK